MRGKIEKAVEALLELLNGLDGPDLEDDEREADADNEESLSHWDATPPANGTDADLELDTADEEPSLGSFGSCYGQSLPQTMWATTMLDAPDECEEENEHGSEDDAGEPMFGSTTCMNQEHAWATSGWRFVDEAEPSLGWTGIGRGHPHTVMGGFDDDREEQHD